MEILISLSLIFIFIIFILILNTQKKINSKNGHNNETNLNEWECPECSFIIQLGTICTYCYTEKP